MKRRDVVELLLLGALWGASFLFMRMGAHDFGPFALVFVRVAGAAAVLLPILAWQGQFGALVRHWKAIALIGLVNSALPFLLYMVAAYGLSAGTMSVFNATAPIWAAFVAWGWLGERPVAARALGLAVGLAGALWLAWSELGPAGGAGTIDGLPSPYSAMWSVLACVAAPLMYGVAANLSRRWLSGVPPMAGAAGSQASAAVLLALPAWWAWPATPPSAAAWMAAGALSLVCTALAYVLYFRLIAHAGALQATSVTFLIPAFAMLWGWLALGEQPGTAMLVGAALILVGTALTTGVWQPRLRPAPR